MPLSNADYVWNRAATNNGGNTPAVGDIALTSLLHFHSLSMNGGVHHAIECSTPKELSEAADGYEYFGLKKVAEFVRGLLDDPNLYPCTDEAEQSANRLYYEMVPDDKYLFSRFEQLYIDKADEFAALDTI